MASRVSQLKKQYDEPRILFGERTEAELREMLIEALRGWHREFPERRHVSMNSDVAGRMAQIAREDLGRAVELDVSEAFLFGTEIETAEDAWKVCVCEAMEWLTRAGFVTPLSSEPNRYPYWYRVTLAGVRFLEATADHPLLPAFIERVRSRCPGIPEGVLALLVDAQACLDHMLLRPAVAVMGLAYEATIEAVMENLIGRGLVPDTARADRAARRVTHVRGTVDRLFPGRDNVDTRGAINQALDFADALRRRRNDASHTTPRYDFRDRGEIEELIVSAGRHLPSLWRLVTG